MCECNTCSCYEKKLLWHNKYCIIIFLYYPFVKLSMLDVYLAVNMPRWTSLRPYALQLIYIYESVWAYFHFEIKCGCFAWYGLGYAVFDFIIYSGFVDILSNEHCIYYNNLYKLVSLLFRIIHSKTATNEITNWFDVLTFTISFTIYIFY